MIQKGPYLVPVAVLLLGAFLSCSAQIDKGQGARPEKLNSYTIRNQTVSYYRIPAGLSREELVKIARKICDRVSDEGLIVYLILIDDVSGLAKYINYAKRASNGDAHAKPPKVWADKHIIANAQKTMNGGWMLYENNGYTEIAYLVPETPGKK